jgi:orotate phosphoribosyltransferase
MRDNNFEVLKNIGVFVENDHFVYTSGKHGSVYVNKDILYSHPLALSVLSYRMAKPFLNTKIDMVIGPAIGGAVLTNWVGYHLIKNNPDLRTGFAEKNALDHFIIKRGYEKLIPNKNILIVEDILNTGKTIKKVISLVRELNGNIIGATALFNRGDVKLPDIPIFFSLVDHKFDAWDKNDCPLCKKNIPINTSLGKGKK